MDAQMPHGVTVTIDVSEEDGAVVVNIDTDEATPHIENGVPLIRVHLNDVCVCNTTPLHDGRTGW